MTRTLALIPFIALVIAGCTKNISPDTYSVGSVGQVQRTVPATVVSARVVEVAGTTGTGRMAGTAAGAVVGSSLGNGPRGNIAGAIGVAVVGSIAGAAIEGAATKQRGIEYIVETDNGNLMTIVQGPSPEFVAGQKVLILYGSPSRLIEDPRQR